MEPSLLRIAERVLDETSDVHLVPMTEFRGGRVVRCRVEPRRDTLPATVIVKLRIASQRHRPWDADRAVMENERAAIAYVSEVAPNLAAKLVGSDVEAGVLIIEDVEAETSRSLAALLLGEDAGTARRALVAYAESLGTLHRASLGQRTQTDANSRITQRGHLRNSADGVGAWIDGMNIGKAVADLQSPLGVVGLSLPERVRDQLSGQISTLSNPGAYLAFTQGDPCPDNVTFGPDGIRFFDFESAAFRHCLLDAAFQTPFPNCRSWRRLPADITDAMEEAYRAALPAVLTTAPAYNRAAAAAATGWLVLVLHLHFASVVAGDDVAQWRRMVATIQTYTDRLDHLEQCPELQAWSRDLLACLQDRWGALAEAPVYPAFGGPAWSGQ